MQEPYRPLCDCRAGCVYCELDGKPIEPGHWLLGKPPLPDPPTFAAELRRAMTRRRVSALRLSRRAGVNDSTIGKLLRGQRAPMVTTAARLADALRWPALIAMAESIRTARCRTCHAPFVGAGKHGRRFYCSDRCARTFRWRRQRRGNHHAEQSARFRLRLYQDAVDAFCRGCAPDLLCKRAECPLRAVSPLPLVETAEPWQRRQPRAVPAQPAKGVPERTRPGEVITKPFHDRWW